MLPKKPKKKGPTQFCLHFEETNFVGTQLENIQASHKSFLSPPPNQTTHKFIFSPKFSIHLISHPNKHTLRMGFSPYIQTIKPNHIIYVFPRLYSLLSLSLSLSLSLYIYIYIYIYVYIYYLILNRLADTNRKFCLHPKDWAWA